MQLPGDDERERQALRVIGVAFLPLATYVAAQSVYVLVAEAHPHRSLLGVVWLALAAAVMFALASGKGHNRGRARQAPSSAEARVSVIDGLLTPAVLLGLILNAAAGLWCADQAAAFVIVYYGLRGGRHALHETVG